MMKIAAVLHDYLHPTVKESQVLIDPHEFAVRKIKVLAISGSGKTYGVSKVVEELMKAGIPVVILDPPGHYWGLKTKYPVIVFGVKNDKYTCRHADHFLAEENVKEQAELLAMLVATTTHSVIIDMKGWSDNKMQTFGHAFFDTLYHNNKHVRHVVVEEADIFAPQQVQFPPEINCRHALDNLVRRGRSEGVGVTIVSQRPAIVYKNILTQAELSIILNLSDPTDIAPADKMISNDRDLTKDQKAEILDRITKLPKGEALFYSPRWLGMKVFAKFNKKETPHTGATRGDPDYIDEEQLSPQFKVVNMDEVIAKLNEFAKPKKGGEEKVVAGWVKNVPKYSGVPEEEVQKRLEALRGELQNQHNKEIIELVAKHNEHDAKLQADLENYYALKEILSGFVAPQSRVGAIKGEVNVKQVDLQVNFQQETVTFSDKDFIGRTALLIRRGFFKDGGKTTTEVIKEMMKLYNLKSLDEGSNRKPVKAALDTMCTLAYSYLKEEGGKYLEGERASELTKVPQVVK